MRTHQVFKIYFCSVLFTLLLFSSASFAVKRYMRPGATGDGSSWANASANFQALMNQSTNGDEIWIAEGTYESENTFVGKAGVQVYGGFPATGNPTSITQAKPQNRFSILKKTTNGLVARLGGGEQYWYGVTLTIAEGKKNDNDAVQLSDRAVLDYCRIIDNYTTTQGGVISMANSARIQNSLIANNRASGERSSGWGNLFWFSNNSQNSTIENSIIVNNQGGTTGRLKWYAMGGFKVISFVGCIIANNEFQSFTNGEGYYDVFYYNTIIWGNPYGGWYQFRNCGIVSGYEAHRVQNSVVLSHNNDDPTGPQFLNPTTTRGVVTDRNSEEYARMANFSSWRVRETSILLKKGTNTITFPETYELSDLDILGEPRDLSARCGIDIGPYAFNGDLYKARAVITYSPAERSVCHTGLPIPINGVTVTVTPHKPYTFIYRQGSTVLGQDPPTEPGEYTVVRKVVDPDNCYVGESTPQPYRILPTPKILVTGEGNGVNTCCAFYTDTGEKIPNSNNGIEIEIAPQPTDVSNIFWTFSKTENRITMNPFPATATTPSNNPNYKLQPTMTKSVAGNLTSVITATANAGMCAPNLRKTFDVNVYDKPTVQIKEGAIVLADRYTCPSSTTTLNASLVGSGTIYYGTLTYRWETSIDGSDFAPAPGTNNEVTYTTPALTVKTWYRCTITYAGGLLSKSTTVSLTPKVSPVIESTSPSGSTTIGQNSVTTLTVNANSTTLNAGENLKYQWMVSSSRDGAYANVATGTGGETARYITPTLNVPQFYKIVVTDPRCNTLIDEEIIEVKIGLDITTQPQDAIICAGSSTSFNVAASGTNLRYQWQYTNNKDDGTTWQDVVGGTTGTLNVTPEPNRNHYYRCGLKSDGFGDEYTYTNIVEAKVVTPPVITKQPVGGSACAGQSVSLSVNASSTGTLTYQWKKKNGGSWDNVSTNQDYTPMAPTVGTTDIYRCEVTASPCVTTISNEVAVIGANAPSINKNLRISEEFCKGTPVTLSVGVSGGGTLTYQWQKKTSGIWQALPGATTANYVISAENQLGVYRCVITYTSCNGGTLTSNVCEILPGTAPRIITQPIGGTVCSTQSYYRLTLEASGKNLTYIWFKIDPAGTPTPIGTVVGVNYYDIYNNIPGTYRCQVSNGCGNSAISEDFEIVEENRPSILTQPKNIQVCSGAPASLSVVASGALLMNYQWESSTDGGITYTGIPDANNNIYTVQNVASNALYRCKVTACGGETISQPAFVSIGSAPIIKTQPRGGSVCGTGSYVMTIAAEGAVPLTYQWQKQVNGVWTNIDAENETSLQVTGITSATSYRCIVTGCGTITSDVVSVQVDSRPQIQTHPQSKTVCPDATTQLNVTATGLLSPTYKWEVSENGSSWIATGSNSAQLTTARIPRLTYFRVTVSGNDPSCGVTTSNIATVTPSGALSITRQPISGSFCPGGGHQLSIQANMSDVTYQWLLNDTDITGATSSTYMATQAGEYKCLVTNDCGQQITSSIVTVITSEQPNIVTQPQSGSICNGEVFSLSVVATGSSILSYQWETSTGNDQWTDVSSTAGGNSPALNIQWASNLPILYRSKISSPNCTEIITNIATVSPGAPPRIITQPTGGQVCRGSSYTFDVVVNGGSVTHYQWQKQDSPGNYSNIAGATSSTYTMSGIVSNIAVRCKIYNNCGEVYSNDAALRVTTSPTISEADQPKSARICAGETHQLSVTVNGVSLVNYDWQQSVNGGAWTSVATTRTYNVLQPDDNKRYKVVVTPIGSGCTSVESKIVTVKQGTISPAVLPETGAICTGGRFDMTITDAGSDYATYQWLKDGADIAGATSKTYAATSIGTYHCRVTNGCGSIDVGPTEITITDRPTITQQPVGGMDCDGRGLTLQVTATGAQPISYQWKLNNVDIPNANTDTYVVSGQSTVGTYFVEVGGCGNTVSSDAVAVKPSTRPIIDVQPSDGTYCSGNLFTTSVVLRGNTDDYTYQWMKQQPDGTWSNVEGATIFTISIGEVGRYRCTVSNDCGTVNSNEIHVRLGSVPTILNTPQSVALCNGETTTFTISASGATTYNYQWRSSQDGSTWSDIPDATTDSYIVTFNGPFMYQCLVGADECPSKATSPRFQVSQGNVPVITTQPVGGSRCNGADLFELKVEALPVSSTYSWEYSSTLTGSYLPVAGAEEATHQANQDGFYKVTITNGCGTVTSNTVQVVQGAASIVAQPQSLRLCPGEFGEISVTVTGTQSPTYQWKKLNSVGVWEEVQGETSRTLSLGYSNVPASYMVEVLGCGMTALKSDVATFSPGYKPVINKQPQGGSLCIGGNYPLSVTAVGSNDLSYLWQMQSGTDWIDVPSSNSSAYTINNITLSSVYRVKVMNNCGEVISDRANIAISSSPTIVQQPQDVSSCAASPITLSVGVRGSGLETYQWESSTDGHSFTPISGATSSTYITQGTVTSQTFYQCKIAGNNSTCGSVISDVAEVKISNDPIVITRQPMGGTVCSGGSFTVSVEATGPGTLTYQWLKGGNEIALATSSSYTISGITTTEHLTCKISSSCASDVSSTSATVSVGDKPTIALQPKANIEVCSGDNYELFVTATGGSLLSYQWERYSPDGVWLNVDGENTPILKLNTITTAAAYRVVVGSLGCSETVTSNISNVTKGGIPVITQQPTDGSISICEVGGVYHSSIAAEGSTTLHYQWQQKIDGRWNLIPSATNSAYNITKEGVYRVKVSNGCGTNYTRSFTVETKGLSIITQPQDSETCAGSNATFTVSATGARVLQYQWQQRPTVDNPFEDINGATLSTYTASSPSTGTQYRVVISTSNPNCGGITSNVATVKAPVAPVITTQPIGGTFCGNSPIRLSVGVSGTTSHTYQWQKDGSDVTGATSSSILVSEGGTYKCKVSLCVTSVESQAATVSQGVSPTITQSPAQETKVCLGETITLSAEVTGASLINYQWYKVVGSENILIPSAQDKRYTLAPTEPGTTSYFLRADATPSGCGVLDTRVVNVVVRPKTKIVSEPVSGSMCSGQTYTLSTVVEPADALQSIQWYSKSTEILTSSEWLKLEGETNLKLDLSGLNNRQSYKAVIATDCGELTTREVAVWQANSPTITSHPESAQLCPVGPFLMDVSVTGLNNPLYQWQYLEGLQWTDITVDGTTNELSGFMPTNTRVYRCVVSSEDENCESVVSNTATLLLATSPVIVSQAPNGTALPNGEYLLFVNAQGVSDIDYQWQKHNGVDWVAIPGAEQSTYVAKGLPETAGNTVLYRCRILSDCGELDGNQIVVTIGNQLTITQQPKSYTICDGDDIVLDVKATGSSDILYQWEYSFDRTTWSNVSIGGENPQLHVKDIEQLTYYRCQISSIRLGTGYQIYTDVVQVGIGRSPIIVTQPKGGYMCPNGTFDMSFTLAENNAQYQWQYKDGGMWVDISNANQPTHTIDNLTSTTVYRGVVSNGCGTLNTNPVTIQVANQPTIVKQPQSVVGCASERVALFAEVTGGTRYTYLWENSADGENWSVIQGANQKEYITSPTATPLFYRVNITSDGCGAVTSKPAKVSNFSGLTIDRQPKSGTSCLNGKFVLYTTATGSANISYQWQKKVGEGRWENIRGAQTYYHVETIVETAIYRCLLSTTCMSDPLLTNEATITVADAPTILEQPQGATLCNESHTMDFVVSGASAFNYQWESSKDGRIWNTVEGATTASYTVVGNKETVMYRVSATPIEQTCGIVTSNVATIVKGFEPIVTLPSTVAVCKNSSYTIKPEIEGSTTNAYLWQQFVSGVWKNIEGEFNKDLELSYINTPSSYRLKVTNGCGSAVSNTVNVSVGAMPTIVKSPKSMTVCDGQGALLEVEATGALLLNYQWQQSTDVGLNWSTIDGATNEKLKIDLVEGSSLYRCIVSGLTNNCGSVNSESATVEIQTPEQPIVILEQPLSGTVCVGNDYKLTVVPSGVMTLTYQWQTSFDGEIFEDIEGAVSATYLLQNVTSEAYYRCVLQSCGTILESNAAHVQVSTQPTITLHPKSGTICSDESYPLRVEVTGINLPEYRWQYSTNKQDWSDVSNANSNVYLANFTQDKLYFRCEIQRGACGPVTSASAVVNKVNNIIITQQPIGGTMCEQSTFKLNTASNIPNAEYQWQEKFGDWFDIAGANTQQYELPAFEKGSRDIRCLISVPDSRCQSKLTNIVTVYSSDMPSFIQQPKDQQVCIGQTVTMQAEATGAATLNYQWQKTIDGHTWVDISDATNTTLSVVIEALPEAYRCVIPESDKNCKQAISQVATCSFGGIPEITKSLIGGTICTGTKFTLSIGVIGNGLKYTWEKSDNGIDWQVLLTDTEQSTYDVSAGMYRVIAGNACGEAISNTVEVVDANKPTIVAQPRSISLCDGENGTLSIEVTGANNLQLQWEKFIDGNWSPIFGATQSILLINRVEELTQYRCKIVACGQTIYSESAFVSPGTIPTITSQPVGGAMCAGEKFVLDVTTNQTDNLEYIWQYKQKDVWTNLSGVAGKQLTVSNLQRSTFYRVIVKNGCGADTSRSSVMVFNATVPSITKQQPDVVACPEEELRLAVVATGGNILNYQWQKYEDQWTDVTSEVSPSLVIKDWEHGDRYRCVVSGGSETCGSINSRDIFLTEGGVPEIIQQPISGTMCPNGQYPLSVITKEGQKVTYQWQYSEVDNTTGNRGDWTDISDAVSSVYNVLSDQEFSYYRVLITNGCGVTTSQEVIVSQSNTPTLVVYPQSAIICNGAEHTLLAEVAGSKNFSYQWQSSIDGVIWLDILGAKTPTYSFKPDVTSNYRFVAIPAEDKCYSITTPKVKIDVLPGANIVSQPKDLTVSCLSYDAQLAVGLETAEDITYRWQQLNGIEWEDLNDAAYSEAVYQGVLKDTLNVLGTSVMGSFEYRVSLTNTTNNCKIHSDPALLLIVPTTTVSITPLENVMNRPEDQVILNSILSGGAAEITYQWLAGTSPDNVAPIADNVPKGASYLDINGETLQFTGIETTKKLYYKLKISAPNCPDAYSNAAMVSLSAQHINVVGAQVITPNGDGLNDVLKHPFYGTESVELRVMNRRGNLVYESKNYDETFSAAGLPQGVYFYSYKVNYEDDRVEYFQGTITVIF